MICYFIDTDINPIRSGPEVGAVPSRDRWMEGTQRNSTQLNATQRNYLSTLPTYLLTSYLLSYLPTYLPTDLPTYLPTYRPTEPNSNSNSSRTNERLPGIPTQAYLGLPSKQTQHDEVSGRTVLVGVSILAEEGGDTR